MHKMSQNCSDVIYVMRCAIWYRLYDFKKHEKQSQRSVTLLKVTLLHGCFSCFLNCTNVTKSGNASHVSLVSDVSMVNWVRTTIKIISIVIFEKGSSSEQHHWYFNAYQKDQAMSEFHYVGDVD